MRRRSMEMEWRDQARNLRRATGAGSVSRGLTPAPASPRRVSMMRGAKYRSYRTRYVPVELANARPPFTPVRLAQRASNAHARAAWFHAAHARTYLRTTAHIGNTKPEIAVSGLVALF